VKKTFFAAALILALIPFANAQDAKTLTRAVTPQTLGAAKAPATAPPYCNPCLFYGGDWPSTASNWVAFGNGNEYDAGTIYNYTNYVPFKIPDGKTWTVYGLFSNNLFYNYVTGTNNFKLDPNTAEWTINQGVTTGSAGTVVASGTAPGNLNPTGRNYADIYFEYTVTAVIGRTGPVLGPGGTYWLGVAPDCTDSSCEEFIYNTDTFLANGFGPAEPKCLSYQNGPTGGIDFQNDCDAGYEKGVSAYMSAGVIGKPVR
jgi:hypothetical protein